jgi:hypothetical protein
MSAAACLQQLDELRADIAGADDAKGLARELHANQPWKKGAEEKRRRRINARKWLRQCGTGHALKDVGCSLCPKG